MREQSERSRLLQAGFLDPARALKLLDDPVMHDPRVPSIDRAWLIDQLGSVGDPGQGLLNFIRLLEAARDADAGVESGSSDSDGGGGAGADTRGALVQIARILREERPARRLFAILGFSAPLSDQFIKSPHYVHILSNEKIGDAPFETSLQAEQDLALAAVYASSMDKFAAHDPDMSQIAGVNAMRAHYWYRIAQIAAEDLINDNPPAAMPHVSCAISDIVGGALEAALVVGKRTIRDAEKVGLTIIAMGKTGARELNYISDVDVVYVARCLDPDMHEDDMLRIATKLAAFVARAVSSVQGDYPPLWELDVNLRPEGKDGPLVRTLESYLAYYKRWASDWEFQALLKARPIAGDMELGEKYLESMSPMIWKAAERENFVEDCRAMRRRVEDLVPAKQADRQLKLGKGGLRDVEFTVQLLQLVHGRTDEALRLRNTLEALAALTSEGYVSRHDGERLASHYRFLRALEHRIQMRRFKRSHIVPSQPTALRAIARTLGGIGISSSDDLEKRWQETRREVRELHLAIYYRPILPQMARLSSSDISLDPSAAKARLAAIGYRDPSAALRHIEALTDGVSRTAAIQKHLLPVMMSWFADGAEPDYGLKAFRILSEQMGSTFWYMRLLRDSSAVAQRLAYVLSASRYAAQELTKLPEAMSWLDDDALLQPRSYESIRAELDSLLSRRTDPQQIALAGRYIRRKELLRTALADVTLKPDISVSMAAISDAGAIAVQAALQGAYAAVKSAEQEPFSLFVDMAIIAMGRFGGNELNYASDADVLFVYKPREGADAQQAERQANDIAKNMMALISAPDAEPIFEVDADLRPEGKNGALARSIDSYREYYSRWAQTWEQQALLRARFVCGDEKVGQEFIELINPVRYPEGGISDGQARDIRAMKARVEQERLPRGINPMRHVKLGRGSLSDVEWTIQLLQLQYASSYPQLCTPSTMRALKAAQDSGILQAQDAQILAHAWRYASLVRNMNVLATGRTRGGKIDLLPSEADEKAVVAGLLGYELGARGDLDEDWLRYARHARDVVERVFYGLNDS